MADYYVKTRTKAADKSSEATGTATGSTASVEAMSAGSIAGLSEFMSMFTKVNTAADGETPVYHILANYSLRSVGGITAYSGDSGDGSGSGSGSGSGAAVSSLSQLSDVLITNPGDGQALVYDANTGKWVNATVSGSGSGAAWGTAGTDYVPLTVGSVTKNLLTAHQSLDNYYTKTQLAWGTVGTDYVPLTVGSTTKNLLTSHQSLTNYYTKSYIDAIAANTYTKSQVDAKIITVAWGTAGTDYVPLTVGGTTKNLLTSHQSLTNYYTKSQVDGLVSGYLPLTGGAMSGDIRMDGNRLSLYGTGDSGCHLRYISSDLSIANSLGGIRLSGDSLSYNINTLAVSGTNVGVGTASPECALHVVGRGRFTSYVGIGQAPDTSYMLAVTGNGLVTGNLSVTAGMDVTGAIVLRCGSNSVRIEVDSNGDLKIGGNVYATGGVTAYKSS